MGLNNLKPADRSKFKKKRVGRGPGSGLGKTSGRGHKGAQSRSGYHFKRGFEGGQMPLHRRVPKRGFTNIFRTEYDVVNLDQLESLFDKGATVTVESLRERGIVSSRTALVKVLGRGDVTKALTVQAHKFSGKAAEKLAAAGGKAEAIASKRSSSLRSEVEADVLETLKNLFAVADLRNRVLFTLGMLAVYRVGNFIPTPGVNSEAMRILSEQAQNTLFGMYDMFTGGSLSRVTIFALGVMPYISSSIILQLLTVVWPYLERLSKEGELGRRKITQYTRYLTLLLAIVQSLGIAIYLERQTQIAGGLPLVYEPGWGFRLGCMLTLTTGTMFIMWLGEQITERGIGNGMSLIIFAGIVVNFPRAVIATFDQLQTGQIGLLTMAILVVLMVGVVAAIIYVERGHRRITVQYAKRVVGRRQYGGSSTHIPLKVNTGGVIPVIFASSILTFPATLSGMFTPGGWVDAAMRQIAYGMPLYNLLYVLGIVFFAYFYTAIIFNPG